MPDRQIIGVATFERCVRARADKVPKVVDAFDQALGSVMKRLVAWTLRAAAAQAAGRYDGYNIDKFRNPANAIFDSEKLPRGQRCLDGAADRRIGCPSLDRALQRAALSMS